MNAHSDLTQVSGGTAGAVAADVADGIIVAAGSTSLNSTMTPTGGYADGGPSADANAYADISGSRGGEGEGDEPEADYSMVAAD